MRAKAKAPVASERQIVLAILQYLQAVHPGLPGGWILLLGSGQESSSMANFPPRLPRAWRREMTERKGFKVVRHVTAGTINDMESGKDSVARVFAVERQSPRCHPVTIIYEPPEPRYSALRDSTGVWEIRDHQEKRWLGTKYAADHPGGAQAAAECEAKRLNEMEESNG